MCIQISPDGEVRPPGRRSPYPSATVLTRSRSFLIIQTLAVSSRSLMMRLWDWQEHRLVRAFKVGAEPLPLPAEPAPPLPLSRSGQSVEPPRSQPPPRSS